MNREWEHATAIKAELVPEVLGVAPSLLERADTMRRWYVLIAMLFVYAMSIADRYVISTVLDPIKHELHLTDSGIAFLTGVSLALFYVCFSLPLAWLMDRGNRRTLIALSLALWSLMTVITGLSRNYWQLMVSRFGVGIGEAGATPGANSLLSDYFPASRRPMALTVFSLGAPIGAWLGADVAGRIADHFGWRAVFLVLGVPGIIGGLLILLTVAEPRRGRFDPVADATPASYGESLRSLWHNVPAMHLIAGAATTTLWGWGLMWWTPAYLMRSYGLSAGEAGAIIGPVHLIGGAASTALMGWYVTRPSMAVQHRIPWLLSIIVVAGTIASFFIYSSHSLSQTKWLFWIFIPSIYLTIGPGFGLLNNLAEPRMRAMFCAIVVFVSNITNLIVAPQLIGFLSDTFAKPALADAASLRLALLCITPTGFWAAYHWVKCSQSMRRMVPASTPC
jgi:MFS family permease